MVRTRADGCTRKAVAAKAPRKALGGANSGGGAGSSMMSPKSGKVGKYAGGNVALARPTPDWQKSIGTFMSPGKRSEKENAHPSESEEDAEDLEPAGSAAASSSHVESAGGSSSASQGSSATSSSVPESSQSGSSSPVKRNGVIESDSDDE